MPTIPLKVQQNGTLQGWSSITHQVGDGVNFGYQAVDDSDSTTHDGANTTLNLAKGAAMSFPLFLQAEGFIPVSITLNVVARRGGAQHPRIQIGFYRGGLTGFDATMFDPTSSFTLAQRTFSTNPITGNPWSSSDLVGLEACVQNEQVNGNNDVTLISGSLSAIILTNRLLHLPDVEVT